jgi:hypothetical protein
MNLKTKILQQQLKKQGLTVMPSFSAKPMDENVGSLVAKDKFVHHIPKRYKSCDIKPF